VSADPNARRARNLARLVILTVALPSLLLTALGAMSVGNEEAASRRRIEKLYEPVGMDMAQRFNAWMDELTEADGPRLGELAAWAAEDLDAPPPPRLKAYLDGNDYAVNYFVLDEDGAVLLPRRAEGYPAAVVSALEVATAQRNPDCKPAWRMLAQPDGGGDAECPLRLAAALCEGSPQTQVALQASCPAWFRSIAVRAAMGLSVQAGVEGGIPESVALDVARILSNPANAQPPWLITLVARKVASLLGPPEARHGEAARHTLESIAQREPLFTSLAGRNRVFQPQTAGSSAVKVDDWRRVLVTRSVGGMLVGYELVPDLVGKKLQFLVAEKGLEGSVRLYFHPLATPKWWYGEKEAMDQEDDVAWWVLLKKTDLAWTMALILEGEPGFWSLGRSRSGLYLWALILIGTALLAGIGHTIYAVGREARLSRLKTDFVSSVSHDLRTPLTSIRMFTETLLMGRASSREEEREFLEVIAQEAERLSRLTERILDFSRMEAGRKAYTFELEDWGALVQHALRSCRPMLEESRAEVKVEIPADLPPVTGDHDALIEVLLNLLTNAIKYSADVPRIRVWARAEGGRVLLSVSDHGIGIPQAEQARIFEKFHRVDCRRTLEVGGCGIGLSLVRHIVEAHEGSVTVESVPNQGSTFTVSLPAAREPTSEWSTAWAESETIR
jgi:two-component system phosphate regulon sensor histidine kinase PhoR